MLLWVRGGGGGIVFSSSMFVANFTALFLVVEDQVNSSLGLKYQTLRMFSIIQNGKCWILGQFSKRKILISRSRCHSAGSAPPPLPPRFGPRQGDLVEANCLLTFVFLHLHVTCLVWFFFFLCPPLLSLAASGLQKQGDITTNGRRGGEERWTEQKKGETAIIKCPCQQ